MLKSDGLEVSKADCNGRDNGSDNIGDYVGLEFGAADRQTGDFDGMDIDDSERTKVVG